MEGLVIVAVAITFTVVLGILAMHFGADSCSPELNDWARSDAL